MGDRAVFARRGWTTRRCIRTCICKADASHAATSQGREMDVGKGCCVLSVTSATIFRIILGSDERGGARSVLKGSARKTWQPSEQESATKQSERYLYLKHNGSMAPASATRLLRPGCAYSGWGARGTMVALG
eukprot:TRINITY_DN51089_c0_g1_i1.p3 TRINITY_DN51089_c0_g1~~TRINITY_DN51089_c0_g1_i1.p3  ORF type:complete len:132 (+),score=10.76 TRINITY_DN51089_c0_g1_i1:413-808(+)